MKTKKINRPGELIYQQMINANLSVRDLAFLLDKTYGVVYYTLRGRENRSISIDFAQKCAVIFKCEPKIYLDLQTEYELERTSLDPKFKKLLAKRLKELALIKKQQINKRHAGRKWKN